MAFTQCNSSGLVGEHFVILKKNGHNYLMARDCHILVNDAYLIPSGITR